MPPLDALIAAFEKFPGVGIRQARRFAFHILKLPKDEAVQFSELITKVRGSVHECTTCHRYFSTQYSDPTCSICNDPNRDHRKLLIVAHDTDVDAIERSGVYDGLYFVLGGTVSLLQSSNHKEKVRAVSLSATIERRRNENVLSEIILAFSVNADGENTGRYVTSLLAPQLKDSAVTISYLGRGLSTGSELEYADPETIKNAITHRLPN